MKTLVLAGLFLLSTAARAADPALVSRVEPYLRNDEKALLAAVLSRPAESAAFDAQARLALKDPKVLKLFLDSWRGKLVDFAESDARHPNPDLEGHYADYAQLMTPEIRAYLRRRLPTMKEDDRNSLIDYLNSVDESLKSDGALSWYARQIVTGIMDHYREDLNSYALAPIAQDAKRAAAAATLALARLSAPPPAGAALASAPVEPAPIARAKPIAVAFHPSAASVVPSRARTALAQAQTAAQAGENAGAVFDGEKAESASSAVPAGNGARRSGFLPTYTATKPIHSAAMIPSPDEVAFRDSIRKLKTGTSVASGQRAPEAAGAILGALAGLLLGPVGIAVGAVVGGLAGHFVANELSE